MEQVKKSMQISLNSLDKKKLKFTIDYRSLTKMLKVVFGKTQGT